MNVKDELIGILEAYGYPVRLQGSLAPNEAYPASFFTFWNNQSTDANHYDNNAIAFLWDFEVNFYSSSPTLVNEVLPEVMKDFKRPDGLSAAADTIQHRTRSRTRGAALTP